MPDHDHLLRKFDNRMRIVMNLPHDVWPEGERRDANPHSYGLWMKGGVDRLAAFIWAPDKVQRALWKAVLDYEQRAQRREEAGQ